MWKSAPPRPHVAHSEIRSGPVSLSVIALADTDPRQWQFLSLTFGRHSTAPHTECLETWPREALALARQALDECEALLEAPL